MPPDQARGHDSREPGGRPSRGERAGDAQAADPGPQHLQPPGEGAGDGHGRGHQGQQGGRSPHTNQVRNGLYTCQRYYTWSRKFLLRNERKWLIG